MVIQGPVSKSRQRYWHFPLVLMAPYSSREEGRESGGKVMRVFPTVHQRGLPAYCIRYRRHRSRPTTRPIYRISCGRFTGAISIGGHHLSQGIYHPCIGILAFPIDIQCVQKYYFRNYCSILAQKYYYRNTLYRIKFQI